MEPQQKRHTALKVRVSDISGGKYVKNEGLEPNYIFTKSGMKVSRANLFGVVVSVDDSQSSKVLTVDDGTGKINVFSFDDSVSFDGHSVGDAVMVIGRPREYNNEKYIVPEIVKKIKDPAWIRLRGLELERAYSKLPSHQETDEEDVENLPTVEELSFEEIEESVDEGEKDLDLIEKVYKIIKEKDGGRGVSFDEVVSIAGTKEAESVIETLLKRGEIFEIAAGRLKVLE